MRVRATVAYDGTDYNGFQRQADVPTVQEALETALEAISQQQIRVLCAGRTDAGVHAIGQVIAFDISWRHTLEDLHRAFNALLPADVAVQSVAEAEPGFHPRFDAVARWYRYSIYNAPVRSPLVRRVSLHVPDVMDVDKMHEAAEVLVGEHDFATFGQPPQGHVTVRRVQRAGWIAEPPWARFDIVGNAFLYHMVRSIVGTLLLVGKGRLSVDAFRDKLVAADRSESGPTAPSCGLCLLAVRY